MFLVDTSVWIEHFRRGLPDLAECLSSGLVLMHPWVCGELACGNLKDRTTILDELIALPSAKLASNSEALDLIEARKLWGHGLGWVDVNLLASALLSGCRFWTLDKQLQQAASRLNLAS
jgi:predicted nucleic acid-binding protein